MYLFLSDKPPVFLNKARRFHHNHASLRLLPCLRNALSLKNKRLFLFGTAGFGIDTAYFDAILARVQAVPDGSNTVIGTYMCQGKMPPSVRARYEAMRALPAPPENLDAMIENFDRARTHPDADDLNRLRAAVLQA